VGHLTLYSTFGVVTTTTPSGHTTTSAPPAANAIPVAQFRDHRGALDAEWSAPYGVLTSTLGGHFSREKDYQSLGVNGKLAVDLLQRRTTLTVGGGVNRDRVFPVGGVPIGLSEGGTPAASSASPKAKLSNTSINSGSVRASVETCPGNSCSWFLRARAFGAIPSSSLLESRRPNGGCGMRGTIGRFWSRQ